MTNTIYVRRHHFIGSASRVQPRRNLTEKGLKTLVPWSRFVPNRPGRRLRRARPQLGDEIPRAWETAARLREDQPIQTLAMPAMSGPRKFFVSDTSIRTPLRPASPSAGFADARSVAARLPDAKATAGAISTSKPTCATASPSIGRSAMRISRPGMTTSRIS